MRAISMLVLSNLHLSYRVRIAFFFNFIFPILIGFAYFQIFAHGLPQEVARMMGPLIALTIMTNSLLLAGMRSAEMRERDMFRQYHLTPVGAFHLVVSDLILGYLTFLPVVVAELGIGIGFYHMPFGGSYMGILAVCSLGYMTLAALGLLLSSIVNTMQEASVVTQLLFFILIFLSGATMPLDDLPGALQRIAIFTPPTLIIVPMQGMILLGDSIVVHLPEMLALALCCFTAATVAVLVFRWDKGEKVSRRNRVQALLAFVPLLAIGILFNSGSRAQHWIPTVKTKSLSHPVPAADGAFIPR